MIILQIKVEENQVDALLKECRININEGIRLNDTDLEPIYRQILEQLESKRG